MTTSKKTARDALKNSLETPDTLWAELAALRSRGVVGSDLSKVEARYRLACAAAGRRAADDVQPISSAWPVPLSLIDPQPLPFSPDMLPEPGAAWARLLAQSLEVDPTMTVMAFLAAVALALMRTRARVVLTADEGGEPWSQPLNGYFVPVAEPSERKSPVFTAALQPILDFEDSLQPDYRRDLAQANEGVDSAKSRCSELRKKLSQSEDQAKRNALTADLKAATDLLVAAQGLVPKVPELLISDVHPNTLARHLDDVGGACGVWTDEGSGPFDLLGEKKDGESAHFGVWLAGYDGSWGRTKRKDVKFSGSPYLSALVFCQPEVLRALGRGRAAHGLGFTARWWFGSCGKLAGKRTNRQPQLPRAVADRYAEMMRRLLSLPSSPHSAPLLYLDDDAQSLFLEYRDEVELMQAPSHPLGSNSATSQWLGKHAARVGRLAGQLHVASRAFEVDPIGGRVSRETMRAAIAIGRAGVMHASAAFGVMAGSAVTDSAVTLLRWLHNHPQHIAHRNTEYATACVRDMLGGMRRTLDGREELDPVLKRLVDLGWLRLSDETARLEKTQLFLVNPALWQRPELFGEVPPADIADVLLTPMSANKTAANPTCEASGGTFPESADNFAPEGGAAGGETVATCGGCGQAAAGLNCEVCAQAAREDEPPDQVEPARVRCAWHPRPCPNGYAAPGSDLCDVCNAQRAAGWHP